MNQTTVAPTYNRVVLYIPISPLLDILYWCHIVNGTAGTGQ